MKIIAIGDLHGKDCWKRIGFKNYDTIIFIGDYTDSYTLSNKVIYENLLRLIELKNKIPEKVILLLGNHDIQYLYFPNFRCSGFREEARSDLEELFRKNRKCFQVAFQYNNYLFTHAGVSGAWWNQYSELIRKYQVDGDSVGEVLNKIHLSPDFEILFDVGFIRGGTARHGGILWADERETNADYLKGVHQIVGHSPTENIKTLGDSHSSIIYIDVLNTKTVFYELSF